MTMYMQEALAFAGLKCAVISLDDVYWKHEDQVALANANPANPLLQVRHVLSLAMGGAHRLTEKL